MSVETHIVIVTYNAMPWLERCLGSIDHDLYRTIVVDNASQDETTHMIKSEYPQVILFEEKDNLGFGQGNNKGISYALSHGAKHVFLLNQDAYLIEDCLTQLVNVQVEQPGYGILSPLHVNNERNRVDSKFLSYLHRDKGASQFLSDLIIGNTVQKIYEAPFVNAAGWLISRSCLMNVGGFDPIFFHYGEDRNYCQRVLYHGFKIGFVPNAFMIHDREDRPEPNIKKFSQEYFNRKERFMKVQYADLNLPIDKSCAILESEQKKIDKKILKSRLKFRSEIAANLKKTKSIYQEVQDQIKSSVGINIKPGPHYLSLPN